MPEWQAKILQFHDLMEEKKNKSKISNLVYEDLKMAQYLSANFIITEKDLNILIFKWRTHMIVVKNNFRGKKKK